jgi:energy-coupling factor transporter ATP-binding protein EcfA2
MIETFRARGYGCLVDVTASLTPLHAFIGPNDSGKSTLLGALRILMQLGGATWQGAAFAPVPLSSASAFEVTYADGLSYAVSLNEKNNWVERAGVDGTLVLEEELKSGAKPGMLSRVKDPKLEKLQLRLAPARMLRLDPDALREPGPIFVSGARIDFADERGRGLPGIYDYIINQNVDGFLDILGRVRRLFPSVQRLGLENVGGPNKVLAVTLHSGARVVAKHMSEGLLYYLAFASLPYITPTSLVLIEEPENGLHPARIAEVMRVLRELSKTTQVVIATHSPLVVNEMQAEEVSVVTRTDDEGTQIKRINETPDFPARSKVYALGELWIAYANGQDEGPLLKGQEP